MKRTLVLVSLSLLLTTPAWCQTRTGTTSWYSSKDACPYNRNPRCPMANGVSIYEQEATQPYFAASWDFQLGTILKVCRQRPIQVENNGMETCTRVTITDRGPAKRLVRQGRILDLSKAAYQALAPLTTGVIPITVEVLDD